MNDQPGRTAHLVGVCGAGMKALAELLLDKNWRLSGSDLSPASNSVQRLIDRGLDFHQGHSSANLSEIADCLVYSPAIPADNPERQEAHRRQLPQDPYNRMVANLMQGSQGVCIAGTHGKSTTTAMTAWILETAGRLQAAVVGAELIQRARSGWCGSGDLFVVESCEFQHSFLEFQPRYTVILGIEHDHFDCYPDFASLEAAFCEFAGQTSSDGILMINDDCLVSRAVSRNAATGARRVSFGFQDTADWTATNRQFDIRGTRFSISNRGTHFGDFELMLHGKHNVANALASVSLCAEIGVPSEVIRDALRAFRGIRRRFEFVGDIHGRLFVDDYAHHPTAVRAVLQTLRSVVGQRRIVCIFQPHQVQRTTRLMDEFAASFSAVDEVWIAPVFAARESSSDQPGRVSQDLATRISSHAVVCRYFSSLDQIVVTLDDATSPEDVIVTMGAGDIDRIHHEFTRRVQ